MWGCDLNKIKTEWGTSIVQQTESASQIFQEKKWLTLKENKLLLTNAGKLFADHIASELFVDNI
jgi:oxygen-independent coproporphyrinogen-3 oxidase